MFDNQQLAQPAPALSRAKHDAKGAASAWKAYAGRKDPGIRVCIDTVSKPRTQGRDDKNLRLVTPWA